MLRRFAAWVREEAVAAGGIGPNEAATIESRHIVDSATFARGWSNPPQECWDLGTGVGFPGVPLAIIWRATRMVLVDRSQRRIDLLSRAVRILDLDVEVVRADIKDIEGPLEGIVSRGAMPADKLHRHLVRLLGPGGRAVVSSSGTSTPEGFRVLPSRSGILDPGARLLIMQAT